jgi:PAS domain S-box-containing protein
MSSSSGTKSSERENLEPELHRVNRALRVVSNANKALTTTADVVAWMFEICQSVVTIGGHRLAWIGFSAKDEQRAVQSVAHAGFEIDYVKSANVIWADELGVDNPVGIAIRTGQLNIARDLPGDRAFDPWRTEAARLGYKSVIVLPLIAKERTFGVLVIHDRSVGAFGSAEVEILKELANDLAFGLTVISPAIVERRSAAEALEESQRKLGQVERISHLARWDRDLETNTVTWSDELYRILGLQPEGRKFHFLEFANLIHPDDRARVIKLAADVKQNTEGFHLDYRIIRPDGQLRFLHGEGEIVRDKSGGPIRSVGFVQDVTEQVVAKSALENANRSLEIKNIAMQEVLTNIEAERDKIGQRINKNVEEMILPLLHSLRHGATRRQQRSIDQIDHCLKEIISPFIDKVGRAVNSLTPAELRVCSYIKRGLAVKQIADLEHLSPETVSAHRRNIRRKLQIAHRKINLTSYLRGVFGDPTSSH